MRLLVISNLYPPLSHGGAERVAFRGVLALQKRGHEVTVFTSRPRAGRASFALEKDTTGPTPIYRIFPPNLYHILDAHHWPFPLRFLWHIVDATSDRTARALEEVIAQVHPDAVITHNLKGLGPRLVETIRRHHLPYIHVIHDVQLSVPSGIILRGRENSWLAHSAPQQWLERRMKRIIGSPQVVLSPSRYLADFYRERGFFSESRIELLPNPTPDLVINSSKKKPSKLLRIFFAGKFERHKGVLFLLDALEKIKIPVRLHMVGSGTLAKYVAKRAERDSRIAYHGHVLPAHLMEILSMCDVSVAPSLCYENSPMVIYESLHAGVPVVASNIGGVSELVTDGKSGYLFEAGDTQQFARAIEKVFLNTDGLLDRGDEIRKSFEQYSLSHYTDRLEEFLRQAVDGAMWSDA